MILLRNRYNYRRRFSR